MKEVVQWQQHSSHVRNTEMKSHFFDAKYKHQPEATYKIAAKAPRFNASFYETFVI